MKCEINFPEFPERKHIDKRKRFGNSILIIITSDGLSVLRIYPRIINDLHRTLETVFQSISKHLKAGKRNKEGKKYSAARCFLSTLLDAMKYLSCKFVKLPFEIYFTIISQAMKCLLTAFDF